MILFNDLDSIPFEIEFRHNFKGIKDRSWRHLSGNITDNTYRAIVNITIGCVDESIILVKILMLLSIHTKVLEWSFETEDFPIAQVAQQVELHVACWATLTCGLTVHKEDACPLRNSSSFLCQWEWGHCLWKLQKNSSPQLLQNQHKSSQIILANCVFPSILSDMISVVVVFTFARSLSWSSLV